MKRKESALSLVSDETADLHRQFGELLKRTNKTNPKDEDVRAFKQLLEDNPGARLWDRIGGLMSMAETFTLENASPLPVVLNEIVRRKHADIREKMGYDGASEVEKLLITHAALCWLRLGLMEFYHTQNLSKQHTLTLAIHYDKRLMMAQKRFTRACETLERVRKLARSTPALRLAGERVA